MARRDRADGYSKMIPVGYMAKIVSRKPDWLEARQVTDIYSVSGCNSEEFADYLDDGKHNGYWLFDSPEIIRRLASDRSISLEGSSLFYYEAYESEFDGEHWRTYAPDESLPINVSIPSQKRLEGFDVVTFQVGRRPECSPLSCNSVSETIPTNAHCLLETFEEGLSEQGSVQ
jgi:hypothetical protein